MKPELLAPVGDFECLKAAVQNGADAVYFGGSMFNARASAANFEGQNLINAIRYAKLRNVKINFALNILLKDDEFDDAVKLAKRVYDLGVDAVIVQDLGLARYIIEHFPDMEVHASTQMTAHNLQGVQELEKLGFKRVVLSRELSIHDIEYICGNTNVEIETFVHGALCISYSGQCLMSSTIGARSGNRGKCAQTCRLPYELIQETPRNYSSIPHDDVIDKGYLLSPRDLMGLEYLPRLIQAGVKSFKIEGRLKNPEYVATVTRIYRKYIDMYLENDTYEIDKKDIEDLALAFNRGGFSNGNFDTEPNLNYVYPERPSNQGIYIGNVSAFNPKKGLVTFTTNAPVKIGDNFTHEAETHRYTVSELMIDNQNVKFASEGQKITIGRIKSDIKLGDKLYKLSDSENNKNIAEFIKKENKKINLNAYLTARKGKPLQLEVTSLDSEDGVYFSMSACAISEIVPIDSISNAITRERIAEQLEKTTDTQFKFETINIDLDSNTYIPKISEINRLRRECLQSLQEQAIERFERTTPNKLDRISNLGLDDNKPRINKEKLKEILLESLSEVSREKYRHYTLLLNKLNLIYDYSKLNNVDIIYIPLRYFMKKEYADVIKLLGTKGKIYIQLPNIIKDNFRNVFFGNLDKYIDELDVKGIVVTNISGAEFVERYKEKLDIVCNYTLNVFNNNTITELAEIGFDRVMLSPELDRKTLENLAKEAIVPTEIMVYGNLPLMNIGYCPLGKSNKCYPTCDMKCKLNYKYYIRDRLGYKFRVIPDNMQTITTIYNSKITSIPYENFASQFIKMSILDESIEEINEIIQKVKDNEPFSGEEYTNGNLNKIV